MSGADEIEIANKRLKEAWHKASKAMCDLPARVADEHLGRLLTVDPTGGFAEISEAHAALSEYAVAIAVLAMRVQEDYKSRTPAKEGAVAP